MYTKDVHLSFQYEIKSKCSFLKTETVNLQQIYFGDQYLRYQCYKYMHCGVCVCGGGGGAPAFRGLLQIAAIWGHVMELMVSKTYLV